MANAPDISATRYRTFVGLFTALVIVIAAIVFGFNATIDPLWYFKGNRWSGVNYSFNERQSKLNLFLQNPHHYDCIVFGASSVTLLDASLIANHHCFNFSFNAGNVLEFIDYANYIKSLNVKPRLIIVGVDLYNFQIDKLKDDTPPEVRNQTRPASALTAYLSWSAADFSLRTIRGDAPMPRNYDRNFAGIIIWKLVPPDWQQQVDHATAIWYNTSLPYSSTNIRFFHELRNIFPDAEYIGFTPYRDARVMKKIWSAGNLPSALKTIYGVSKSFDRFYDFTVPSKATIDSSDTYDGYHFGPNTTRHIAEEFNGVDTHTALPVFKESFEEYRGEYMQRFNRYLADHAAN